MVYLVVKRSKNLGYIIEKEICEKHGFNECIKEERWRRKERHGETLTDDDR